MATYYSDLINKVTAGKLKQSNGLTDGDDKSGTVLYATCRVTLTGTEVAGEIINLVDLPVGAVVIPALCHVSNDGTGATAFTLNIGDSADPDRYAAAVAGASAGTAQFTGGVSATVPFRITQATTRVTATVVTKTGTITANKLLVVTLAYRVKG